MSALESPGAAVGQVWQSWDVRERPGGGTYRRITKITMDGTAICQRLRPMANGAWSEYGKPTEIAISRLRPTANGYRLIEDAPAPETSEPPP